MKDPYVRILEQRTWFNIAGTSTVDRLLAEQMKAGSELSFDVYEDPDKGYQFLGRAPFWSPYDVYRGDTKESKISHALRSMQRSDEGVFAKVEDYLAERINGVHPISGFEYFALWELLGLRKNFSRDNAQKLASIMEKNLFSFGITKDDRLPPSVKKGYLFNLHFHIDEDFDPPSKLDLAGSYDRPVYVGAYAAMRSRTRIYMCHRGESRVIGEIPNDPALAKRARSLLEKPEVEAGYDQDCLHIVVRSGQLLGAVHLFGLQDGTLRQIWSLTGSTLDDLRKRHLHLYQEIDGGFIAQTKVPSGSEGLTLFAFNVNNLGRALAVPS